MTKAQINQGMLLVEQLLGVFVNEMKQQNVASDMLDLECLPNVFTAMKTADELTKLIAEGCVARREMMEANDN